MLGIKPEKIIIGGFSQGAAMSFYLGLKHPEKLGGIAALSGYLPLKERLLESINNDLMSIPIFMGHGLYDNVIDIKIANSSFEKLSNKRTVTFWFPSSLPLYVQSNKLSEKTKPSIPSAVEHPCGLLTGSL